MPFDVVIPAEIVSNGKGYKVTEIDVGAFKECSSLESAKIPNSIERIGESSFDGCSALESVLFMGCIPETDKYAFRGCSSIKTFSPVSGS